MNERETAALQIEDLTYNADGLIPCIVQDEQTREVLMMAWMNEEAVRRTISQGTTFAADMRQGCRLAGFARQCKRVRPAMLAPE